MNADPLIGLTLIVT